MVQERGNIGRAVLVLVLTIAFGVMPCLAESTHDQTTLDHQFGTSPAATDGDTSIGHTPNKHERGAPADLEQETPPDTLEEAMAAREHIIAAGALRVKDSYSTKIDTTGFLVGADERSTPTDTDGVTRPLVPVGGYITMGPDARFRVFDNTSKEIWYSDAPTPISSMRCSVSAPSGSTVYDTEDIIHIAYNGTVLATIVDARKDNQTKDSMLPADARTPGNCPVMPGMFGDS